MQEYHAASASLMLLHPNLSHSGPQRHQDWAHEVAAPVVRDLVPVSVTPADVVTEAGVATDARGAEMALLLLESALIDPVQEGVVCVTTLWEAAAHQPDLTVGVLRVMALRTLHYESLNLTVAGVATQAVHWNASAGDAAPAVLAVSAVPLAALLADQSM